MKLLSKLLFSLFVLASIYVSIGSINAQQLEIIPESNIDVGKKVDSIKVGGEVRKNYNEVAKELDEKGDLGAQMASGVFTRDTLLDYLVYLVKFLSQLGIFVGACFIIYAGYIYASSAFTGKDPSAGKTAISNSVTGVIIITFSYAIMRGIMAAFLN